MKGASVQLSHLKEMISGEGTGIGEFFNSWVKKSMQQIWIFVAWAFKYTLKFQIYFYFSIWRIKATELLSQQYPTNCLNLLHFIGVELV